MSSCRDDTSLSSAEAYAAKHRRIGDSYDTVNRQPRQSSNETPRGSSNTDQPCDLRATGFAVCKQEGTPCSDLGCRSKNSSCNPDVRCNSRCSVNIDSRVTSQEENEERTNVELLLRVFPQMKKSTLEIIMQSCNHDVVKSIEQVLRNHARDLTVLGDIGAGEYEALSSLHSAYPSSVSGHRYFPPSSHPCFLYGQAGKSSLPLMPALPGLQGGSDIAAARHLYGSSGSSGRNFPPSMGVPYHPAAAAAAAAFLPGGFGGLRYNYSAMVAAMVASAGGSGKGLPVGFPYLPNLFKAGSSDK